MLNKIFYILLFVLLLFLSSLFAQEEVNSDKIIEYQIQEGDCLTIIAVKKLNKYSAWKQIYRCNFLKIVDPNKIRTGDKIFIPLNDDLNQCMIARIFASFKRYIIDEIIATILNSQKSNPNGKTYDEILNEIEDKNYVDLLKDPIIRDYIALKSKISYITKKYTDWRIPESKENLIDSLPFEKNGVFMYDSNNNKFDIINKIIIKEVEYE